MREIYLAAFEGAVKKSHPWSLMAACNQVNHVQGTENQEVLENNLRNGWRFDGFLMSDEEDYS